MMEISKTFQVFMDFLHGALLEFSVSRLRGGDGVGNRIFYF